MTNSRKHNNTPTFNTSISKYEEETKINHKRKTLSPEQYTLYLKLESLKATIKKISSLSVTTKDYEEMVESCKNYRLKEKILKRTLNQQLPQQELRQIRIECTSLNYYIVQSGARHHYNNEYLSP